MRVDLFDFELPPERIALRPARPRDSARMLVVHPQALFDRTVADLPGELRPGDMLVLNDTKVIPAQLEGRAGEARVGVTLHRRIDERRWSAFVRNARRLKPEVPLRFADGLLAHFEGRDADGAALLRFAGQVPLEAVLEAIGRMPLPPYIATRRPADAEDRLDYQTMFAERPGAVAAPTAGLHFTERLVAQLEARGVELARLTLHVGAGTFLPVRAEDTADHRMHGEVGELGAGTAERLTAARAAGRRIVAVGTTVARLLETAAGDDGRLRPFRGATSIFITPGYRFRALDGLLTNFHLPRSTLFMLVSALMGLERMQGAYRHAVESGYRFYSYGDACLLWPRGDG